MNYIEYTFHLEPLLPAREVLVAELADMGFESFVELSDGLQAYVSEAHHVPVLREYLQASQIPGQMLSFSSREIPDENWNAEWEKNFDPIAVEDLCLVRAPFHHSVGGYRHELIIEPKMSFGTGHHATTWLMLRVMYDLGFAERRVLDMGSGTGVLAILAARLGASSVDAIDVDEWAYRNALENVERNGAPVVRCELGDAALLNGRVYDIILANINRNILVQDAAAYQAALAAGGFLLLSGFYSHDIPILLEAFGQMREYARKTRGEWALVILQK